MFGKRIDFLLIGAQKCGTSSFVQYVKAHPQLDFATKKEMHFFNFNWHKGKRWYHEHFAFNAHTHLGEATPYYMMHPEAALRAHQYNPGLKIIALLRNPTERAYAHYQMNLAKEREPLSFLEALQQEETRLKQDAAPHTFNANTQHGSYKTRGLYAQQLRVWEQYFSKEQMLVLNYHNFFQAPWANLQPVFKFLEVAPFYGYGNHFHLNQHTAADPMPEEAVKLLKAYFSEPNQQLAQQFNIHF